MFVINSTRVHRFLHRNTPEADDSEAARIKKLGPLIAAFFAILALIISISFLWACYTLRQKYQKQANDEIDRLRNLRTNKWWNPNGTLKQLNIPQEKPKGWFSYVRVVLPRKWPFLKSDQSENRNQHEVIFDHKGDVELESMSSTSNPATMGKNNNPIRFAGPDEYLRELEPGWIEQKLHTLPPALASPAPIKESHHSMKAKRPKTGPGKDFKGTNIFRRQTQ
ncbi:hypothetical protein EJ08DRAFT_136447 [Tothia fuscella]|uniref:Uncharacterized protein n=1 Tax=Tothia fuscella TaxID=1048955 RepID=A0A9P4NTY5_9PEZI|nr:hypothetical protein EJ08DRAFT_136447 [Tothia fuscella]